MKRNKFILIAIFLLISVTAFSQQKTETILFDCDAYSLRKGEVEKLKQLSMLIHKNQILRIHISGHTDSDGTNNYNNLLSKRRIEEVYKFFTANGIDSDLISSDYFGENKPLCTNNTSEGMQQNRRVEISIDYSSIQTIFTEEAEIKEESLFGENAVYGNIFKEVEKPSQYFTISGTEEQVITGKEGTVLTIPKKAFLDKYNKMVKEEIEIELKEFYKKSDIVLNNLTTMSNDDFLESGGMLYINAKSNGEDIFLAKGKSVGIEFATEDLPSDMEVFLGNEQDDGINWISQRNFFNSDMIVVSTKSIGTQEYRYAIPSDSKLKPIEDALFGATKLGWINCDRFYKNSETIDLVVDINSEYKPHTRMIFKNIKGVMSGYSDSKGNTRFIKVPVGKKVTILAFSMVNDETYYAIQEILIKRGEIVKMDMQPTTVEELKVLVTTLD